MRGRKPKPTAIKKVTGNPGKRALNKKEPKPEVTLPACPAHLHGTARTEWKRITKELYKLGMITELDRAALAVCCSAYADYVTACNELAKSKAVLRSKKGGSYQNLWVSIKRKSMEQVIKFYAEFGMTPSSRARVKVELPDEEDKMTKYLFGNRNVPVKAK